MKEIMIKISIVGDIVCDKKMLKAAFKDNKYSFDEMFSPLNNYFKDSDYVIGNLESVISHKNYTNSTFSFWAAFLNPNEQKLVIAPNVSYGKFRHPFACDEWIVIDI